ncbi:FitA-like ribbon-helix-helix domain-containing protein [Inquilinus sp. OTU3971]|uniref:FitA-like ribbon-helix-helix domain-containing protein n=1 Tax=Inquilinus sp. OTU3971 TaxID=3043855 RepID=UPI00313D3A42
MQLRRDLSRGRIAAHHRSLEPAFATIATDAHLLARLRRRAARNVRSIEEEALDILRSALSREPDGAGNLADAIRQRFAPFGGVDLPDMPREAIREPFRPDG